MILQSKCLRIAFAEPGTCYAGSRFDWHGFITQVTLDGRHTFCVPESLAPGEGTGGIGLCNEFGIFTPIGYDEVAPGECFPKLGVGLLRRIDRKPYSFFKEYPIDPFPRDIEITPTSATFHVHAVPCNGYAAELTKRYEVIENRLHIAYDLRNVGEKPFATEEYVHNFFRIDEYPVGPDYRMTIPSSIEIPKVTRGISYVDGVVRWQNIPSKAFHCPSSPCDGEIGSRWEILHLPTGVGVRGVEDFPLANFALYGTAHSVCPEMFNQVSVAPGACQQWARTYEFFS